MQPHFVIAICLIIVAVTTGCSRNDAAQSAPVSAPEVVPQPSVAMTSGTPADVKTTEEVKSVPEKKPATTLAPAASDGDDKKAKVAVDHSERLAILAPGGPITVEVLLTIDGRPQADVFEDVVGKVLKAAHDDKLGHPTWKSLSANKEYLASQQGNMPPGGARQMKMWTDQFDQNRDGRIQRDEAASWLGRDAGISARAFDVRGTRSYISVPSATSRIWRLLDLDEDSRLSQPEIARGADTLFSLDNNDDAIVDSQEVAPLREQLRLDGEQASRVGSTSNPYAAIYLKPQYEVNRLGYLLGDLYAPRQVLQPASFGALAGVYKQLDTNGDDQLTQSELAAMRTMSPQLKLTVDFRQADAKSHTSLTVLEHVPEIALVGQPGADQVVLSLGTTRIVVSAHDLTFKSSTPLSVAGSQVRMMVHDQCDALGEILDANADGKLGEREIATCAERLSKWDANEDGQITNDELPYTMIAALVRGEQPGEQSLYRPTSASQVPVVADAPSWFVHADYNGDGDVSRREFLGATEQFSSLDENQDGFISADEAKRQTILPKDIGD
jgi:Ca2+-binding EF-hand superfamily protein